MIEQDAFEDGSMKENMNFLFFLTQDSQHRVEAVITRSLFLFF